MHNNSEIRIRINASDFKKKLGIKDGVSPTIDYDLIKSQVLSSIVIPEPKNPIKGVDYFDGLNGSPDSGGDIVAKINSLPLTGPKIDASQIKNLSSFISIGGAGLSQVFHDTTLTGKGTQQDPLKAVTPSLSAYWKTDGSTGSATGDWAIGNNDFSLTNHFGLGTNAISLAHTFNQKFVIVNNVENSPGSGKYNIGFFGYDDLSTPLGVSITVDLANAYTEFQGTVIGQSGANIKFNPEAGDTYIGGSGLFFPFGGGTQLPSGGQFYEYNGGPAVFTNGNNFYVDGGNGNIAAGSWGSPLGYVSINNTLLFTSFSNSPSIDTNGDLDNFGFYGRGTVIDSGSISTASGAIVLGDNLGSGSGVTINSNGLGVFANSLTATAFITSGGALTDFVKGDGSLDSTSYQPAGSYPKTVSIVSLTNQSADITSTVVTGTVGLYRVEYSLQDTTSDITAGAAVLTIAYTDGAGSTTSTATQVLTGVGRQSGVIFLQLASGNLTYAISHTGLFGTAKFALYITTEKL